MAARVRPPLDSTERSVPDLFEAFDLPIERVGETYRAEVTASPVGPRPPVEIDPEGLDGDTSQPIESEEPTRDVRRRPADRDDLRHLGENLFTAVFVRAIEAAFRASVERTKNRRVGLGVRLQLSGTPELATLPWEALWDPEGRVFLADQPNLSVTRTLNVPAATPDVATAKPPLRMLALLPEPKGESKLGGEAEWRRIQEHLTRHLDRGEVTADCLDPPTLETLGRRIDEEPCHVLHVVAHGGPGDRGAGGLLKLEDESGKTDPVSGGDLARALERRTAPRLVVLSTCHGARAAVDDAFDGMAQHLLNRGVPAVVAMRTAITDAAAESFSVALYRELARGRSVEGAMVEARRVLSLGAHRTEWATPVLYLRGENLRILDAVSAIDSPPAGRAGGGRFRKAALLATVAIAGILGLWMARSEAPQTSAPAVPPKVIEPGPCPPPLGLEDLRFVVIEPGVVDLGDRLVIVEQAFCIGTQEVSRRDWLAVTGDKLPRREWPPDWPMTVANPEKVSPFLQGLEARDPGTTYRLPTAAEWELAARADQTSDYFFGDDPSRLHHFGNCDNFQTPDGYDGPAPVDSYTPNPWGLYNVHGNVAEWVEWPPGSEIPVHDNGNEMALRLGGSYKNAPASCAFGARSEVKADASRSDTGFRVVRELPRGDE